MKITEYIEINNTKLCVSIRTKKPKSPILLYLHGGPGDAAMPLVAKYNRDLENIYTVVTLEQRGAGKSYYLFSENENIDIDTFVEDIYALSIEILKRYNQEKLYLVGHSWGSVLGIKFIKLNTIRLQIEELAEIQNHYVNALTTRKIKFDGGSPVKDKSKQVLTDFMTELDKKLEEILETFDGSETIDWFGENKNIHEHISAMIGHEQMHIGQIVAFCYATGINIPDGITSTMALDG